MHESVTPVTATHLSLPANNVRTPAGGKSCSQFLRFQSLKFAETVGTLQIRQRREPFLRSWIRCPAVGRGLLLEEIGVL